MAYRRIESFKFQGETLCVKKSLPTKKIDFLVEKNFVYLLNLCCSLEQRASVRI